MSDDLHYLPATEALARFRDRSLSPVELLDAVIARAEAVEPTVNALCHERFEEARAEAARPRRATRVGATASRARSRASPSRSRRKRRSRASRGPRAR
jgi:Asp-tRNA(Asn)/Glu-tRNA(Gln) amidotransferase A subunit family amidase